MKGVALGGGGKRFGHETKGQNRFKSTGTEKPAIELSTFCVRVSVRARASLYVCVSVFNFYYAFVNNCI